MTDRELFNRAIDTRKPIVYTGQRGPLGSAQVKRNGALVSQSDYNWGYNGGGPWSLAWWLLSDATGSRETADTHVHAYKEAVVANWPREGWQITSDEIRAWIAQQEDDALERRAEDAYEAYCAEVWYADEQAARDEAAAICAEF